MASRRIVTGAHYGLKDWLAQRITAVVLLVYTLILIGAVSLGAAASYDQWAGLFGQGWFKIITLLAMLALCWHAWVGVRDIYMDYIKPTAIRLSLQVLTIIGLIAYLCWTVLILWKV
ncbi:MAG: succinate dehydrogenase, hydrophobic rane anchor protein [Pseudomonadota bacterium]|jgi:succinate dehydrogenase / fumarate reductase membrane anchor subunit